jgi:hypothetical protein
LGAGSGTKNGTSPIGVQSSLSAPKMIPMIAMTVTLAGRGLGWG